MALVDRLGQGEQGTATAPAAPEPATSEVRARARSAGLVVPGRGRLRPDIRAAWAAAHPTT